MGVEPTRSWLATRCLTPRRYPQESQRQDSNLLRAGHEPTPFQSGSLRDGAAGSRTQKAGFKGPPREPLPQPIKMTPRIELGRPGLQPSLRACSRHQVGAVGLEPTSAWLRTRCYIQLSYAPSVVDAQGVEPCTLRSSDAVELPASRRPRSGEGRTRTDDTCVNSAPLWPLSYIPKSSHPDSNRGLRAENAVSLASWTMGRWSPGVDPELPAPGTGGCRGEN